MQIRSISVSHQRKVPHPCVDFANLSTLVTLQADLDEQDNVPACTKKLLAQAENLTEQHLESIAERMRQRSAVTKPQVATANTADSLAAKHGGK